MAVMLTGGSQPEEECEYFALSGDTEKGASGMYVRLPNECASPKHWHTSPMHLVGLKENSSISLRMPQKFP